jgi:hypothetical protein
MSAKGTKVDPLNSIPHTERSAAEKRANDIIPIGDLKPNALLGWVPNEYLTTEKANAILQAVANGRSVQGAARENDTTLITIVRHRMTNVEFNDQFNTALQIRALLLEEKAWELAVEGVTETVTKGSGDNTSITERVTFPNAALLQFLLKAFKPDKYGVERQEIKTGPMDTPPDVVRNENDRTRLVEKLQQLAQKRADAAQSEALVDPTPVDPAADLW